MDILSLVDAFLDNHDNPKKEAYRIYMERSGEMKKQLGAMKTDMSPVHVPVGDKIRAALPGMLQELTPLREQVEMAPGMLDLEEDRLFRAERGYWARRTMDTGVTVEIQAAGPVRQPEMV